MKSERDTWVDVAKGICMLLIFGIHTEAYVTIGMPLTYIAVPMFFFMSGFYDRSEISLRDSVVQWMKTLWLPIVLGLLFGSIYNLFLDFMNHVPIAQSQTMKIDYIRPNKNNGATWFLFALSYVKILMWFLTRIPIKHKWIFPVFVVLGYIGSTFQLPLLFDEGLAALPFYGGGKILYMNAKNVLRRKDLAVLGGIFVFLFCFHTLSFMINPMACGLYSPYYILSFIGVSLSFIPVLYLSGKLENVGLLKEIGKHTLGLLIFQLPLCSFMSRIAWRVFERETIMWYVLSAFFYVLVIYISYKLTLITEKYCPILLGKK